MVLLSYCFIKFFLDLSQNSVMGLFKLAWVQFKCQHMEDGLKFLLHLWPVVLMPLTTHKCIFVVYMLIMITTI